MYQTAYIPLASLGNSVGNYLGGICQFWYTPIQNLAGFPVINPLTQQLATEPLLKTGTIWYGPVNVPNNELGFDQQSANSVAGRFFKRKVQGVIPGLDAATYINTHNTLDHQLCVVAKLRSSNMYLVIGNDKVGLDLEITDTTGVGVSGLPSTKLTLTDESITGALVLKLFALGAPRNPLKSNNGQPILTPNGNYILIG